ncbi:hypothetical protein J3R30DRAFT_766218 [Lentinula aciculospora]|uniref:Uncharacterized protein n=1 Tax=Lentinula aciculospora TaxID=153920 RepID=A0A9W9DJZ1_9AGAR|nr:hypothetical protein J3R30DRAFT_766218 [Lentinula aciculospora]
MSSSPPPASNSALYAYKLREDGYDVALLPPSPRSSTQITQLVAPKPNVPFAGFTLDPENTDSVDNRYSNTTYPPPANPKSPRNVDVDNEDNASLYSSPSAGSFHASLSSPPPPSLLPYTAPSRPSSAAEFLPRSNLNQQYLASPLGTFSGAVPESAGPYPTPLTPSSIPSYSIISAGTSSSNSLRKQTRFDSPLSIGTSLTRERVSSPPRMIRVPSEETRVLAHAQQQTKLNQSLQSGISARGSVVLYRLDEPKLNMMDVDVKALLPPNLPFGGSRRGGRNGPESSSMSRSLSSMDGAGSVRSTSSISRHSVMSGDSRIPLIRSNYDLDNRNGVGTSFGKGKGVHDLQLVAYAYQPDALLDGEEDDEDDDWLHDPRVSFYASPSPGVKRSTLAVHSSPGLGVGKGTPEPHIPKSKSGYVEDSMSLRGLGNYFTIWLLLVGLVALFIFYPVVTEAGRRDLADSIVNNPNINETGQATAR